MDEAPRERAISSEPCSGRPNPFDDVTEQVSRKRQRVSRGGSRSRSVDAARDTDIVADSMLVREGHPKAEADPPPSTPTREPSEQPPAEPTSSRVTINLRTNRTLEAIPSSPPSPSTPSKMVHGADDAGTRISIESESDVLSTIPPIETPSSSASPIGSPQVELIPMDNDDSDFNNDDLPVAIINDDSDYLDLMSSFPYKAEGETLANTVNRLSRFIQFESIDDDACFCKLRDWIESYLFANNDLELFYQSFAKHREFWGVFPDLIWCLSYRSRFFGDFLKKSREGRQSLTEFLCQFARLTGKFLAMDARTLDYHKWDNNDQEPDLGSRVYICAFSFLLRKEEHSHIGRNLEAHYQWNWDDDAALMSDSFQTEGGSILNLTKLVRGQLRLMSRNPKLVDAFTDPCRLACKIFVDAAANYEDGNQHPQVKEAAWQKISQGYDFYTAMSVGLETIIEKHVTFLSPDAATTHLYNLPLMLKIAIHMDIPAVHELLESKRRQHTMLIRKQFETVISREWKFTILKKLITSAQMQLRVVGVTTMCSDLLELYQRNKGQDPTTSPMLLYFAEFVLANELVDYIVGIGSHPEIINESNNILGFLIVTKTYKSPQTDKIWQTVMTSQDPRVVEAILRMVMRCLNLYDCRSLLYICKKVCDVPIESFTVPMREFSQNLFKDLVLKIADAGQYLAAPPYDLCVRLIRESSIISAECPMGYPEIQAFAAGRLRELLQYGPSPEARTAIYLSCLEDISSRSSTAPGSICVINGLIRQNILDLRRLCNEHGLTQLVIEELESAVAADRHSTARNSPASNARRELLMALIIHEPATINPDLGKRLWDVLVGSASKSALERNSSWLILNSATKKSSIKNVFLASCYREYLPKLPPSCFTTGTLDFAREAIFAWLDEVRLDFVAEDRTFDSHALEQLWRMILTAPPNTIDAAAISILVEVYVDNSLILTMPRAKARSIHLALVDRCLDQLKTAASKLKTFSDGASSGSDEGMVIVASEDQFQEQEKIFARSLAVLREFLRAYQSKPQFATPKPRSTTTVTTTDVEGEPLTVKYQSFDGNTHTEVKSLTLGKLNTAAALFASLQKATGFKNYKVYCGGKEFDPDEVEVCKSLDDLNLNGLVLIQRREDSDGFPGYVNGVKPTLESEIMKHFDDLWGYLSMHEKVAQEIYYFLVKFPVYERLMRDFDTDTSHSEIFPTGQPFKSLYAIHALKEYIVGQTQKGSVNETALTRAISLIIAALSDRDVLDHCASDDLRDCLALHLIDCFVHFMKEPIPPASIAPYLNDILLQRLLQLLHDAKGIQSSQNSVHLTWRSFEAILEGCIHNPELWSHFASYLASNTLLRELLLDDPRPLIRKSVAKHIVSKCTFSPSLAQVSTTGFVMAFWPMVASLIPEATKHPYHCEEIFSLAHTLLKRVTETSTELLNMEDCVTQWGDLLLNHSRQESVGHSESIDLVAQGLATLLSHATSLTNANQKLIACSAIGPALFRRHLFPDLTVDDDQDEIIVPTVPLLNPVTRRILAETILNLVKDDEPQYRNILAQLTALVPYVVGEDGPYAYDLGFQFDRSKAIRSQTGYVGLKNLSNTCYLNSLFTQLYMNIPFREFMLNAHVADGGASQKLLSETQNLFSYMQNSFQRSVSPANLASSIRTYEEGQIDVNIQMDVDEFYNLLFDRWESQILAPDAKRKFRSFYGGQLVQQVKSKECSHISERLEPFSAIQCDIKGKSSLQESLQAYVDGEVMEGDNKYKCSGCDRHVDAVKRACLKDIPDNLIFHLKRFDFNLRTLQRSKINDHFSFPTKIDMRPYKVEHLMDTPEETPEDIFELVGILVHSGTAESGHYYSFIRERPSNGEKENWIEFNDDTVSPWDPNQMENSCFGGPDYRGPVDGGNLQYDKSWSAYMLFYQRSSELAVQKQSLQVSGLASPLHLPISPRLSNHIAMENELFLRKYCLYDPSHAMFVTKTLAHIKHINGGQCSHSHTLEKLALYAALNHLDQVIARTKDLPDFPAFMLALRQICHQCAECSRDYLEWYCDLPETLRVLLLRNPDALVRTEIASSIIAALNKVNADAPYAYGLGDDDEIDADDLEGGDPQLIQRIVKAINRLWDIFHTNIRAWPEYFGLLASIAKMGKCEATLLLDAGYLRRTLELISADVQLPISTQYSRMLGFINKRVATRPVSYESVVTLLWRLLDTCDASIDPIADDDDRIDIAMNNMAVPLSLGERNLLLQHWTRTEAHIVVEKLLQIHQNDYATEAIIVALLNWPDTLDDNIYAAITHGIRRNVTSAPCGPFLRAALTYCLHSTESRALVNMVMHVTKVATHVENVDGKEFLQFFKNVMKLECVNCDMEPEEIHQFFLEQATQWGPGLLTYYEMAVRADTEDFLQELIIKPASDASDQEIPDDESERERLRLAVIAGQKLGVTCLEYLQDSYVRPRQTAVRAIVANILTVIEACQQLFDFDSKDQLTRRFAEMSFSVTPAIKKNMVEEADEEVSDWDGSQDDYDGSSEPMDSIAELGPADNEDAV
ncbi:ubiquitin C-terminal hydrolase-like protein [Hyaloscypha variabilis]